MHTYVGSGLLRRAQQRLPPPHCAPQAAARLDQGPKSCRQIKRPQALLPSCPHPHAARAGGHNQRPHQRLPLPDLSTGPHPAPPGTNVLRSRQFSRFSLSRQGRCCCRRACRGGGGCRSGGGGGGGGSTGHWDTGKSSTPVPAALRQKFEAHGRGDDEDAHRVARQTPG